MNAPSPLLFQPYKIRSVELKNRIMIAPMGMFGAEDGIPTDFLIPHYGQYAIGGAGLVIVEATAVEERGRIGSGDLGLWKDEQIVGAKKIADTLRSLGSVPGIQLAHSGLKGSCSAPWEGYQPLVEADAERGEAPWTCVAPSVLPGISTVSEALSLDEIEQILVSWEMAAERALKAGYEILEIHAAHGYLINQFLSPLTNHRTDEYGGGLYGRMRFALEIAERVRKVWPDDKPLFFRLSVIDGVTEGWSVEDSKILTEGLTQRGVDFIDCSSGGTAVLSRGQALPREPGFQVFLAEEIKRSTRAGTVAVGLITDAHQAEEILQRGQADLIAIAREALFNPYWPLHAAQKLGVDPDWALWPPAYGWWLERRARVHDK